MSQIYDADELSMALQRVSADVYALLKDVDPSSIVFVGILTNGLFFAKRIQALLKQRGYHVETPVMGLDISLYRDDYASKNKDYMAVGATSQPVELDKKHVVLFDDVICTARTVRAALNAIFDYGRPEKVSLAALYDRGHRQVPIEPNVIGQHLDVDMSLRVNVGFFEVIGEDNVMTGPFPD